MSTAAPYQSNLPLRLLQCGQARPEGDEMHHLYFDPTKGFSFRCRIITHRNRVGILFKLSLRTKDAQEAKARRDMTFTIFRKLGLEVSDRRQARKRRHSDEG